MFVKISPGVRRRAGLLFEQTNHDRVGDIDALLTRVIARDATAFESMYDRYGRLVFGIARRILGDDVSAEDVTQAVFLKVWHAPTHFRMGSLSAWLARVARNAALDVLRTRSRHPTDSLSQMSPPTEPSVQSRVDDVVIDRLTGEAVRNALASVPEEQRSLIEMAFFDGLTHQQMAQRTETPLGTVKTRIRSGLRRLRTVLIEKVER